MSTALKSLLLLAFTLIVGFSLGLFADATLVRGRRDRISRMGRPPGMVQHLERVIRPRDSVQMAAIRPLLQHAVDANEDVIRQANASLRANMDSLRVTLVPLLDPDQRSRLERELSRMPRVTTSGPGSRGRGGPRGRRGSSRNQADTARSQTGNSPPDASRGKSPR
jgi:hypothetical protein